MRDLCRLIGWTVVDLLRLRATLEAEIWTLREQINVLRRAASSVYPDLIYDRHRYQLLMHNPILFELSYLYAWIMSAERAGTEKLAA
jgi:hypothetical protein